MPDVPIVATDWKSVVASDVDAVVISTPTMLHAEIAMAAMHAGKHVLCEKPLGLNVEEAEQMCKVAAATGRILKSGFNYRHMAHVQQAKNELEKNTIGAPHFLRCRFGHGGRSNYAKDWNTNSPGGGRVLLEQGIHVFDLVRYLLGEPTSIVARINQFYWPFPEDAEDNGFCLLQTTTGQIAQIHVSWTQWRNIFEVEIFGKDGYMRLEGRDGHYGPQRLIVGKRQEDYSRPTEKTIEFANPMNAWTLEWNEFRSAIAEGRQPNGSSFDGLQAQRLVEAAYKSSETNTWITL